MNAPDDMDQSAAMTSAGNDRGSRVEQDGGNVTEHESEDELPSKKRRKRNG